MQGKQFRKREAGQGLVEYALIMVLVAIVVIVVLVTMGPAISDAYCGIILELNPGGECTAAVAENNEQPQQEEDSGLPKPVNISCINGHEIRFLVYYNGDVPPTHTITMTCPSGGTLTYQPPQTPSGRILEEITIVDWTTQHTIDNIEY